MVVLLIINAQSKRLLKKILFLDIIATCQKGVKHVHNYICNLEINKCLEMFMVVDCINIVVGWRFLWPHLVIFKNR